MSKKWRREIAVCIVNSRHGDFLKSFADAYLRADIANEVLLRDPWNHLIHKYNLDKEYPEKQGAEPDEWAVA